MFIYLWILYFSHRHSSIYFSNNHSTSFGNLPDSFANLFSWDFTLLSNFLISHLHSPINKSSTNAGGGQYFRPDHLYTTYWSAVNFPHALKLYFVLTFAYAIFDFYTPIYRGNNMAGSRPPVWGNIDYLFFLDPRKITSFQTAERGHLLNCQFM